MDKTAHWDDILEDLMTRQFKTSPVKTSGRNSKKISPGEEDLAEISARIKELKDKYGFNFSDDAEPNTSKASETPDDQDKKPEKNQRRNIKNKGGQSKSSTTAKGKESCKTADDSENSQKNININFNINNNSSLVYFQTLQNERPSCSSSTLYTTELSSTGDTDTESEEERDKNLLAARIQNKRKNEDLDWTVNKRDVPSCSDNATTSSDAEVRDIDCGSKERRQMPPVKIEDVEDILSNYNPKMSRFLKSTNALDEEEKLRRQRNNEASRRSRAKAKLLLEKLRRHWTGEDSESE